LHAVRRIAAISLHNNRWFSVATDSETTQSAIARPNQSEVPQIWEKSTDSIKVKGAPPGGWGRRPLNGSVWGRGIREAEVLDSPSNTRAQRACLRSCSSLRTNVRLGTRAEHARRKCSRAVVPGQWAEMTSAITGANS